MMNSKRITLRSLVVLAAFLLLPATPGVVHSQSYPTKPIRLLVGFPPGGGTDAFARLLGQHLSTQLGKPVIVDNRPGADATIAMEIVAKSAPDGHTLYLIQAGVAINPALYSKVPFDPIKDFAPITLIGDVPGVIAIHPSLPAKSLQEFLAYAKARKGQLFYGTTASGIMLASEMLNMMAGTQIVRVSYKGAAPATTALITGEVQLLISGMANLLPFATAGKLRLLAITSEKRSSVMPDLPTAQEAGLPGYVFTTWYGFAAPGGTPRPIIDRLNSELRKILADPTVISRLNAHGIEPTPTTPEQFSKLIRSEIVKWDKVVKSAGLRIE